MSQEKFTPEGEKQVDPRFATLESFLKAPETRLSGGAYVEEYAIDNVPSNLIFTNFNEGKNCRVAVKHGHGETVSIQITGLPNGVHFALEVKFKKDGSHTEAHYLIDGQPVQWDTPENEKPNVDALINILVQSKEFQPQESGSTSEIGRGRYTYGFVQAQIRRRLDYTVMHSSEPEKEKEEEE